MSKWKWNILISYKVLSVEPFNVWTNLITVSNLLAKTDPKVQLITNNFPLHNIHNIWDPSPTVHPSTCTQRSTFTQTHWHALNAQVLTTFLLHSCARRQDSINNLFELDPVGFSVWNFEHPGIVLYSIIIFPLISRMKCSSQRTEDSKTASICQSVSRPGLLMDYRCQLIRANKCATAEQLPVLSWIEITGTQ